MSAYWLLENLWAFSVQFALVAGVTLALARLGRRAAPAARLALLQLGLLAALCGAVLAGSLRPSPCDRSGRRLDRSA
ncbi:MAG: hypothetical protein R2724_04595 [Bryobacterales bacterium]